MIKLVNADESYMLEITLHDLVGIAIYVHRKVKLETGGDFARPVSYHLIETEGENPIFMLAKLTQEPPKSLPVLIADDCIFLDYIPSFVERLPQHQRTPIIPLLYYGFTGQQVIDAINEALLTSVVSKTLTKENENAK